MPGLFGWFTPTPETTPLAVQQRLQDGERVFILDVREPAEYAQAHVPGSTLIPLGQLAHRVHEIPRDRPIVAICRSGNRSGTAVSFLQKSGFDRVENLRGGIVAWARSGGHIKNGR